MTWSWLRGALLTLLGLGMAGCVPTATIPEVADKTALAVAGPEGSRPVQLRAVVIKIRRGETIGALEWGVFCTPDSALVYGGGRLRIDDDELTEVFRDELKSANYRVVGDPDALFENPEDWKAEYLIAGTVEKMLANVCYPYLGWGNTTDGRGEGYMEVAWQIYSRLDRKVVYQLRTEGRGKIAENRPFPLDEMVTMAFAQATRHMLADQGLHDLLTGAGPAAVAAAPKLGLVIGSPRLYTTAMAEHLDEVRLNVVTVFAGDGHGSGFFIDDRGHLLTNEHVVRGANYVKVRLLTGREVVGEVLAADARRDVALVGTEPVHTTGLPLNLRTPAQGTEVYVLGSPLDKEYQGTLTRGIVSANRPLDGQDFIQGDVGIMPGNSGGPLLDAQGNVLGIADLTVVLGDAASHLNFFIPIGDALDRLGITAQPGS